MSGSAEPPILFDGRLTLGELLVYARLFDELSQGQHYTACDFLEWVRLNAKLETRYHLPAGRPGQMRTSAA